MGKAFAIENRLYVMLSVYCTGVVIEAMHFTFMWSMYSVCNPRMFIYTVWEMNVVHKNVMCSFFALNRD